MQLKAYIKSMFHAPTMRVPLPLPSICPFPFVDALRFHYMKMRTRFDHFEYGWLKRSHFIPLNAITMIIIVSMPVSTLGYLIYSFCIQASPCSTVGNGCIWSTSL